MMLETLKRCGKYIFALVLLFVVYIVSLFIIAKIPKELIKDKTKESAIQLHKSSLKSGYDWFTDAVMFDISYRIDNKDALKSVLKSNIISIKEGIDAANGGYNPVIALEREFDSDVDKENLYTYSFDYGRYWHGYLTYLRPLTIILNYNQMAIVNVVIILILLIIFEVLVYDKLGLAMAIIMGISLLSINYFQIGFSLSIVQTLIIMMLFSIYILLKNGKIKDIGMVFLINGSVSCFFSWMTFVPLTLGLPLIIYFLFNTEEDKKFRKFIYVSIIYLISYSITWFSKWVITDLICKTSIIKDGFNQILFRAGSYDYNINGNVTISGTICRNIVCRLIFFVPEIYYVFFVIIKNLKRINLNIKEVFKENYIYLIIGIIPFIIYIVARNHSYVHADLFSNKLLMLTECGIMILAYKFDKKLNNKDKKLDK